MLKLLLSAVCFMARPAAAATSLHSHIVLRLLPCVFSGAIGLFSEALLSRRFTIARLLVRTRRREQWSAPARTIEIAGLDQCLGGLSRLMVEFYCKHVLCSI